MHLTNAGLATLASLLDSSKPRVRSRSWARKRVKTGNFNIISVILTVTKLGQDVAPSFRLHGVGHTEVVEGIGGYMSRVYLNNIVRILKSR